MKTISTACLCAALTVSCGTQLHLTEASRDANDRAGIPINQVRTYSIGVETQPGPLALAELSGPNRARLVDPIRVTEVNTLRMPFASGKLQMSLDEFETANKIGITSTSGAAAAASSATTIVETADKLD